MSQPAETTVTAPMDTVQINNSRNPRPKFRKLALNSLQKMQTEEIRLSFRLKCRICKRPPPPLRATGFKALNEVERIELLSDMESTALAKAIMRKKKEVKLLKRIAERSNLTSIE